MALVEKLHEERVDSENYVAKVQVWRSGRRGGHKKIRTKFYKKRGWLPFGEKLRSIRSFTHRSLYSDERFAAAIASARQELEEMEKDLGKFNT